MAWDTPLFRPGNFTPTTAFRITCIYLAVFIGCAAVLGAATYFGVSQVWRWQIREEIRDERQDLRDRFAQAGRAGLRQAIAELAEELEEDEGYIYLLQDPDGTVLAGQLPSFPVVEGWQEVVPPGGEEDEPFIAVAQVLSDGSYFLIGRDGHDLYEVIEFLEEGLAWTFVFLLPLSLIGGIAISSLMLRRVEAINRSLELVRGGDLGQRIPVGGANDEFDRLAGGINAMLDGIVDLTDGLRQVSRDIAHDLRTPLTRVRQKLELLEAQAPGSPDRSDLLATSIEEVDRLLDAFNALLRIAQIESGTRKSGFKSFDLSEAFHQILEDYELVAEENGKIITGSIEENLHYTGDRSLIIQMLVNLIENAIRHTPPGTKIDLALQSDAGLIAAIIADDGPGIPVEDREKVLGRFYRVDRSRLSPGSGLGLSLVAAVAKLHGIAFELVENGPGLKVRLRFPSP